jgi:hypothetical protein
MFSTVGGGGGSSLSLYSTSMHATSERRRRCSCATAANARACVDGRNRDGLNLKAAGFKLRWRLSHRARRDSEPALAATGLGGESVGDSESNMAWTPVGETALVRGRCRDCSLSRKLFPGVPARVPIMHSVSLITGIIIM